jgi:hypothetical protein
MMPPPARPPRVVDVVAMLRLRSEAVAHFVAEARRERTPSALSAAQFHAAGMRRYSAETHRRFLRAQRERGDDARGVD